MELMQIKTEAFYSRLKVERKSFAITYILQRPNAGRGVEKDIMINYKKWIQISFDWSLLEAGY